MKKMRRFMSLMLAMVMVLAMGMSAMAADQTSGTDAAGKGSITITNPVKDQTYTVYKIFEATVASTGDGISYTATDAQKAITGFSTYFNTDTNNTVTITDAGKDSTDATKLSSGAVSWIKENLTALAGKAVTSAKKNDDSGNLKFAGLDYGYYYIDSTNGSVVSISSTNPDGSVTDKNPVPTLDKDIESVNGTNGTGADNENGESATAKIGDTINYTIAIKAQKGAENYVFHDKLSAGLTLVTDNNAAPVVKVGDTSLTKGTDYSLTKYENNTTNGTEDNITITFEKSYLDTITEETIITITYSAVLNENAVIEGIGNKNTATLDYGHRPDTEQNTTPPDEPKVYCYKFQLVKDNNEDEILTGAEFKIYDAATSGNEIAVVKTADGAYRVAKAGETGVAIEAGTPIISGLAAGEYWLEEIKAPSGYNQLENRVKVEIVGTITNGTAVGKVKVGEAEGDATATFVTEGENAGNYESGGVEVENNKGATLPSTGGIGTTMFYVVGGALVLVAVVLLVTRKRMSAEK